MKEGKNIPCPKCGGNLLSLVHQSVTIDHCEVCAGIWLDEGELEKILGESPWQGGDYASCPKCSGRLCEIQREGLNIDICLKCNGIWCDKGELDYLEKRAQLDYTPIEGGLLALIRDMLKEVF